MMLRPCGSKISSILCRTVKLLLIHIVSIIDFNSSKSSMIDLLRIFLISRIRCFPEYFVLENISYILYLIFLFGLGYLFRGSVFRYIFMLVYFI
jgi:hypothetical protein